MGEKTLSKWLGLFFNVTGLHSPAERLLHQVTLFVLVFFALLLASKPIFGTAINCQVPKDWPSSSNNYFHDMCYYGQRTQVEHIVKHGQGELNIITGTADYYLWIPSILMLHVFLCVLPGFFWNFVGLGCFQGSDMVSILEPLNPSDEDKKANIRTDITDDSFLSKRRANMINHWIYAKSGTFFGKSRTLGVFVLMKWFRFALFVFQFKMIADIFADGDVLWGFDTTMNIINGVYMNPLKGEFTLLTGCEVQRIQMGSGYLSKMNFYTSKARCVLGSNYLNAKAFLFIYWWFILCMIVCFTSAFLHTLILSSSRYRKYVFKSLIPREDTFVENFGHPHKHLRLSLADPIDYLIDYLGNDGYLLLQMIFDELHYNASRRTIQYLWQIVIANNGKDIELEEEKKEEVKEREQKKKRRQRLPLRLEGVENDGRGDAGKEKWDSWQKEHLEKIDEDEEAPEASSLAESLEHFLDRERSTDSLETEDDRPEAPLISFDSPTRRKSL